MKIHLPKISLLTIINDFKNFTFKRFIDERFYLHFGVCALITAFSTYPLAVGFFVTVIAVFREAYYTMKNKAPFDWEDIRWTYYGCIFTFLIKLFLCI